MLRFILRVFALLCPLLARAAQAQDQFVVRHASPAVVDISVDARSPGATVAPELFGGFIEATRASFNNGIMAQILVNPSLESGLWDRDNLNVLYKAEPKLDQTAFVRSLPLPWLPWDSEAGNRFELRVGDAANSYQSVAIFGSPGADVGIQQHIYLPTHRASRYIASAYVRRLAGRGPLTFALRDAAGKIVAHSEAGVDDSAWKKVSVTLDVPQGSILPLTQAAFGVYVRDDSRMELDQISLMPADAVDGFDPDVLAMASEMGMTELRLGGNYGSTYHWRDGIGDPDRRHSLQNAAWGIPEYNSFGTDEFLNLCRRLHVVPQFDVNMGSGTADETAAWVKYIRARYKEPIIWELGNELWGPWQIAPPTLQQFPEQTRMFSDAVRKNSPGDTIIATGSNTTQYGEWITADLKLPRGTFDFVSLHFVQGAGRDKVWKPRDQASTMMMYAKSFHVGETFPAMQVEIERSAHRDHVHLAMTEWLFISIGEGAENITNDFPAWNNQGGAVAAGGFVNTLFRHAGEVRLADMTGMIEYAGIAKAQEKVFAQPSYYVFQMYSTAKGQRVLPVSTNSGTYAITDPRYLFPSGADVPFVDATATLAQDGASISLFLANRSQKSQSIHINVPGWEKASATITTLAGQGTFDQNTSAAPRAIAPTTRTQASVQNIALAGESVTRIVLRK